MDNQPKMEPDAEIRVKKMSLPARPKSSEELVAPHPGGRRSSVDVRPNQLPLDKLPSVKPPVIREQLVKPPVTRDQLAKPPVTREQLAKPAVTREQLAKPAVTREQLAKPPVTREQLAKPPVTREQLAKPAVTREQLAKSAVIREHLATIPGSPGEYTEDKDIRQRVSQPPPGATPIVLRLRNEKGELNIIRFVFIEREDTVEAVTQELVEVGLVHTKDGVVISNNLRKILEDKPNCKHRVFYLYSGSQEVQCDTKLIGFAKLSLADPVVAFT